MHYRDSMFIVLNDIFLIHPWYVSTTRVVNWCAHCALYSADSWDSQQEIIEDIKKNTECILLDTMEYYANSQLLWTTLTIYGIGIA